MNFSCCVTLSASHEHRVQLSPALGNWIRVRSALLLHCWASLTLLFALLAYPFVSHAATLSADFFFFKKSLSIQRWIYSNLYHFHGSCIRINLVFRAFSLLLLTSSNDVAEGRTYAAWNGVSAQPQPVAGQRPGEDLARVETTPLPQQQHPVIASLPTGQSFDSEQVRVQRGFNHPGCVSYLS